MQNQIKSNLCLGGVISERSAFSMPPKNKKGRDSMINRIFGTVTGGRLNLRTSADSSASILVSIPNETLLVITFIRLPVQPAE